MATLDNPNMNLEEENVPFMNAALKNGGIGGIILVLFSLVTILMKVNMFSIMTSLLALLAMMVIYIGVAIWGNNAHKNDELNGLMSFKRGFILAMVTMIIMGFIGTLFTAAYYNFVNPNGLDEMAEQMRTFMENMNAPEASIEEGIKGIKDGQSIKGLSKSLGMNIVLSAIGGLIVGAITKKDPPRPF